jgi:hypothetical protein
LTKVIWNKVGRSDLLLENNFWDVLYGTTLAIDTLGKKGKQEFGKKAHASVRLTWELLF